MAKEATLAFIVMVILGVYNEHKPRFCPQSKAL